MTSPCKVISPFLKKYQPPTAEKAPSYLLFPIIKGCAFHRATEKISAKISKKRI